jgi:rubrerythrin
MGILFSGRELVSIGMGIEVNGAAFYDSLAGCAKDDSVKTTYRQLADKEREHVQTFQKMLSSVSDYDPPETLTEEYEAYMRALVDSLVFTDEKTACDLARRMSSDLEAVRTALIAEKDSILFYTEMRDLVRAAERHVVDQLIAEEKSHVRELTELMRNVSAGRGGNPE